MSERVSVLVCRQDGLVPSRTVVVSALRSGTVSNSRTLRLAVTRGVTKWMEVSEVGQVVWDGWGCDFNVGDLSSYLDAPDLLDCLKQQGVFDLSVDEMEASDWMFDTSLVMEGEDE